MYSYFFLSTLIVELFGTEESIATVKSLILVPGLFTLISAMAVTGGTGFTLSKSHKGHLVDSKKKRMPFIAENGIFILIPCAIFLDQWASSGSFSTKFYIVQSLELLAGLSNLTMMGFHIRDGLKLTANPGTNKQHE
jgi:hypothetical protein